MGLRLAIVSDNQDPDGLRRCRVISADRGVSASDWVPRITGHADQDLPAPPIGSAVLIGTLESGTSDEVILGVVQTVQSNPALTKENLSDLVQIYYGHNQTEIRLDYSVVARSVTLDTKSGSQIRMTENGDVIISNPDSSSVITMSASGTINMHCTQLLYNGEQVAVVGGNDTRGDMTLR